jgi:YbbR domain-containing protein
MMHALKEFFTRNRFPKVLSLVIAALLWVTIASETTSEIGMIVPLEYRNIASQLEVIGDTTDTVEVRLRGSGNLIKELAPRDVSATVDLSGVKSGEKIVQLTPQNVRAPFGIEVVRVNPSRVHLIVERTVSKMVPVKPRLEGGPAKGYEVETVVAVPYMVEVEGPESRVQTLDSVPTAPVLIRGRASTFSEYADLDVPDPMIRLQYRSPVEVRVGIREQTMERKVTITPDAELQRPTIAVTPATIQVTVRGPKVKLSALTADQLHFTVDLEGLLPGLQAVKPTINGLTEGLEVVSTSPETVNVAVHH